MPKKINLKFFDKEPAEGGKELSEWKLSYQAPTAGQPPNLNQPSNPQLIARQKALKDLKDSANADRSQELLGDLPAPSPSPDEALIEPVAPLPEGFAQMPDGSFASDLEQQVLASEAELPSAPIPPLGEAIPPLEPVQPGDEKLPPEGEWPASPELEDEEASRRPY